MAYTAAQAAWNAFWVGMLWGSYAGYIYFSGNESHGATGHWE